MTTAVVEHATKYFGTRFGRVLAVDDLSFEVGEGRVTGFLGPNGAGKTTTMRMMLGLVTPTSGSTAIDGRPYHHLASPLRQVGAVLEASGFHPGRSAAEHLGVVVEAAGLAAPRVGEVLELVGLADAAGRKVRGFSMGMRQRLALATALLGQPRLLMLDEPANGLDPEGMRWLRALLRTFADQGGSVLISSHVLAEVAQVADEVVIIVQGRLVAQTSLSALTDRAGLKVRVRTPQAEALRDALAGGGIHAELAGPDVVVATGASLEQVGPLAFAAQVVIYEMGAERSNLEEVFLQLTGEAVAPGPGGGGGGEPRS